MFVPVMPPAPIAHHTPKAVFFSHKDIFCTQVPHCRHTSHYLTQNQNDRKLWTEDFEHRPPAVSYSSLAVCRLKTLFKCLFLQDSNFITFCKPSFLSS